MYRLNDESPEKRIIAIKNINDVYNEQISKKIKSFVYYQIYDYVGKLLIIVIIFVYVSYLVYNYITTNRINNFIKYYKKYIKPTKHSKNLRGQ